MCESLFLYLPLEIRLLIYDLLLNNHENKPLSIRSEDPSVCSSRKHEHRLRSSYRIMSDPFRSRGVETSYHLLDNPGVDVSILRVNRRIHAEASPVLYSKHVFDFGSDVESVIPFLGDLTPLARGSIKRINIVKRALPYTKDFDRCEWRNACAFISKNLKLVRLGLGVSGGCPQMEWEAKDQYEKSDFTTISEFEGMEWMRQLSTIKGLQDLDIKAHMQHCPPPCSNAMAFFINFSASIETGFAEYLKEQMVAKAA